jgi:hypothetical protein
VVGDKIAPGFADWYLARTGFDSQQTDLPVEPGRPDNLFEPAPGDVAAHGPFDGRAKARSLQFWATKHRRGLLAAAAALAALAAAGRRP